MWALRARVLRKASFAFWAKTMVTSTMTGTIEKVTSAKLRN